MAQHFATSIYGVGSGVNVNRAIGTAQGIRYSFPSEGTIFYPDSTAFNGVTVGSIIEVLPTGLQAKSKSYYSVDSVAALTTAANA